MSFKTFWKNDLRKKAKPRVFSMVRKADETGTSGTGHVLDGVIFPCGKVAVCWDPDAARVQGVNSIAIYDSYEAFEAIHIGQHPSNKTEITFYD